jgi:transposase
MPAPIPESERKTIVHARNELHLTYEEIAALVRRGRATVSRVLRLQRESGAVAPEPARGGNRSPIRGDVEETLKTLVAAMPDATIEELAHALEKRAYISTSESAVGRALRRLGYTLKKSASSRKNATRPSTRRGARRSARR